MSEKFSNGMKNSKQTNKGVGEHNEIKCNIQRTQNVSPFPLIVFPMLMGGGEDL